MTIDKERRLLQLSEEIESRWVGVVIGWNLGLGPGSPEDVDIVLEAFSVEEGQEREFLRAALPLMRQAEQDLGKSLLILSHAPEATRELYPEVSRRIRTWKSTVRSWSVTLALTNRNLASRPQAA